MTEEKPVTPPPELMDLLEQTIGTPPEIVNPVTDIPKALQFHRNHNATWALTVKGYFSGDIPGIPEPPT